jgi:hypothetical protein
VTVAEKQYLTVYLDHLAWPATTEFIWRIRLGPTLDSLDVPWDAFPHQVGEPTTAPLFRQLDDHPLSACVPACTAAFMDYLRELLLVETAGRDQVIPPEAFHDDLQRLLVRPQPAAGPTPGRNDPCPCGSGQKYKKCCQGQGAPGNPLQSILLSVPWPALGYRLLPSEQVRDLGADAVRAHLDIFRWSPADMRQRLPGLTDDYLLWAAAIRLYEMGQAQQAAEVATLVAASDQRHPALHYPDIERQSQTMTLWDRSSLPRPVDEFRGSLRAGLLAEAWTQASDMARQDPPGALDRFLDIQRTYPENLWTAAAMAEALAENGPALAIPHVRRALAEVEAGHGSSHPLLPDRPCPAHVLRGYLEVLEERAQTDTSILRALDQVRGLPLSVPQLLTISFFQFCYDHLPPTASAQLAPGAGRVLTECLSAPGAGPDRTPILTAAREQSLLWVLPVPAGQPSALLSAATATLQEAARGGDNAHVQLRSGRWGRWTALHLQVVPPDEDLVGLAHAILAEKAPHAGLVYVPWDMLPALASEAEVHALLAPDTTAPDMPVPVPPTLGPSLAQLAPVPPDQPLLFYLQRVLLRLIRMRKIGAAHTALGHFISGVPSHHQGAMKEVLDVLMHEGYVRYKPTLKDPHISLEPTRLPAIWRLIQQGEIPSGRLEACLSA